MKAPLVRRWVGLLLLAVLVGGAVQTGTVALTWDAPATGVVTGYCVYRQQAGDALLLHAVLVGESRLFTETVPVGLYQYVVTAYNTENESPPSNTLTVEVAHRGRGHTKEGR